MDSRTCGDDDEIGRILKDERPTGHIAVEDDVEAGGGERQRLLPRVSLSHAMRRR